MADWNRERQLRPARQGVVVGTYFAGREDVTAARDTVRVGRRQLEREEVLGLFGARQRVHEDGGLFELHPSEAEGYFLNLTAPDPKAFVLWRMFEEGEPPARPVIVTVSYNEAGRFMDGGEQVEGVALAEPIAALMRAFVAQHYRPEPKRKVRRNDPFAADATGRRRP